EAGRFRLFDDRVGPLCQNLLRAIPGSARTRAFHAPVVLAVEIAKDAVRVSQHVSRLFLERGRATDGCRQLPIDLRTGFDLFARCKIVENLAEALGGEVLIVVVVDLRHWCVDARPETLNFDPRELAVLGHFALVADALAADLFKIIRATQPARRRAAKLYVKFSNRPEIEHRVERSNFQSTDVRHAEEVADMADRRLRQPAAVLFLCAPE